MKVEVDFDKIDLTDDKEDGALEGDVRLILYKGNHYHLTIVTDDDDYLYCSMYLRASIHIPTMLSAVVNESAQATVLSV